MLEQEFVLKNARIVLPTETITGAVSVKDGKITDVSQGTSMLSSAIDLEQDYIFPGLIEMHTDNFEQHYQPRPAVKWNYVDALIAHDRELVSAGITTVFDALGIGDPDPDALRSGSWDDFLSTMHLLQRDHLLRASHFIHARCELPAANTLSLFEVFEDHALLRLVSLMDHTPGQRQWENIEHARIYYTGKKSWSNEKFEEQLAKSIEIQEKYVKKNRQYLVDFCKQLSIPMASHDDTKLEHVQQAYLEGASISEFPTTMLAAQEAKNLGLQTVMGAPNIVRGGSHSGNVAAMDLVRGSLLDILSSDYIPTSLLGAVSTIVNQGVVSLSEAVALVSYNVAQSLSLHDRGAVLPGLRADLLRVKDVPMGANNKKVIHSVWVGGKIVFQ